MVWVCRIETKALTIERKTVCILARFSRLTVAWSRSERTSVSLSLTVRPPVRPQIKRNKFSLIILSTHIHCNAKSLSHQQKRNSTDSILIVYSQYKSMYVLLRGCVQPNNKWHSPKFGSAFAGSSFNRNIQFPCWKSPFIRKKLRLFAQLENPYMFTIATTNRNKTIFIQCIQIELYTISIH